MSREWCVAHNVQGTWNGRSSIKRLIQETANNMDVSTSNSKGWLRGSYPAELKLKTKESVSC